MLTDKDRQDIASIMTDVLSDHDRGCPRGIDADTAAVLKSFADSLRTGRKALLKTSITMAAGLMFALFGAAVRFWFKQTP